MNNEDYIMVGERITKDGDELFSPDYYDDGCSFGTFFKDEKAFREEHDQVCYIPEAYFDDEDPILINGKEFYAVGGYTRKDLEALIEGEKDEDDEPIDVEYFFEKLCWACPETYINEMNY